MISSRDAMGVPQLFSHDYYFRLGERKLGSVQLVHSFTVEDAAVFQEVRGLCLPAHGAGITEWEGVHDGHPLSLGWDWMQLVHGEICPVMIVAPRTNILIVDRQGYDIPQPSSVAFLWEFIAGLPWQHAVRESIRREKRAASKVA